MTAGGAAANGYNIASGILVAIPTATFTRPNTTTAFATGQLVANSATATSVVPLSWNIGRVPNGTFLIRRVKIFKTTNNTTNASFTVHFYSTSPTATNGDGGTWLTTQSGWIGSIPVTVNNAFSDGGGSSGGVGQVSAGLELNGACQGGGTTLYGLVVAAAAYTGTGSESFTVVPEVWIN